MKKNFKFYIALWGAKFGTILLKILKRNATFFPGKFALKICPDFMARVNKPKTIIAVTGTNGKTTVCNMIEDVLKDNNVKFIDNRLGSNVNSGVATTLIKGVSFLGKAKSDVAILEIDERSANRVYPYLTPTYLICTNLFRDSMLRNAHAEFIADILTKYIPKETKLILNGDDLISSNIAPNNDRVYFGIDRLETDVEECHNIVQDIVTCPKCDAKLEYDFVRYHHIGRAHCPKCDFASPKINYEVINLDLQNMNLVMKINKNEKTSISNNYKDIKQNSNSLENYNLITNGIINIYNMLATISVLKELGYSEKQINNSLKNKKVVETRFSEEQVKNIKIVSHLAKGMNPIACSRVFDYIKREPGKKAVILILDDFHETHESSENITWHYDTDYEFLNDESIKQIITTGVRHQDTYIRLQLADIAKEKIVHIRDEIEATNKLELNEIDTVFILYDVYTIHIKDQVKSEVEKLINEREECNENRNLISRSM